MMIRMPAENAYVPNVTDYKFTSESNRIDTKTKLKEALVEYGISTENWVKTVDELWREVSEGDCILEIEEKKLVRKVDVIQVRCFYTNSEGKTFQLYEEKQVFENGIERNRGFDYVSEKKIREEPPENGALRALKEELQVNTDNLKLISEKEKNKIVTQDSPSYLGIQTVYTTFNFSVQIPENQYCPQYQEKQADKTTYFLWKLISSRLN